MFTQNVMYCICFKHLAPFLTDLCIERLQSMNQYKGSWGRCTTGKIGRTFSCRRPQAPVKLKEYLTNSHLGQNGDGSTGSKARTWAEDRHSWALSVWPHQDSHLQKHEGRVRPMPCHHPWSAIAVLTPHKYKPVLAVPALMHGKYNIFLLIIYFHLFLNSWNPTTSSKIEDLCLCPTLS